MQLLNPPSPPPAGVVAGDVVAAGDVLTISSTDQLVNSTTTTTTLSFILPTVFTASCSLPPLSTTLSTIPTPTTSPLRSAPSKSSLTSPIMITPPPSLTPSHCSGITRIQRGISSSPFVYSSSKDSTVMCYQSSPVDSGVLCQTSNQGGGAKQASPTVKRPIPTRRYSSIHSDWVTDLLVVPSPSSSANQQEVEHLITASSDGSVALTNTNTGSSWVLGHHRDFVKALSFDLLSSPSLSSVLSAGLDGTIRRWDLNHASCTAECSSWIQHSTSIYALHTSPTLGLVGVGSPAKSIALYPFSPSHSSHVSPILLHGHTDNVKGLYFSSEGHYLVSSSSDGTMRAWDLRMNRCLRTLDIFPDSIFSLLPPSDHHLSSDPLSGAYLAGCKDGSVYAVKGLFSGANQQYQHVCSHPFGRSISSMLLCPPANPESAAQLLTGSLEDSDLLIWDIPSIAVDSSPFASWRVLDDGLLDLEDGSPSTMINGEDNVAPLLGYTPSDIVPGRPGIRRFAQSDDKVHVVYWTTHHNIVLMNILTCYSLSFAPPSALKCQPETVQSIRRQAQWADHQFQIVLDMIPKLDYNPSWCTLDINTAELRITIHPHSWEEAMIYLDIIEEETGEPLIVSYPSLSRGLFNVGHWLIHTFFQPYDANAPPEERAFPALNSLIPADVLVQVTTKPSLGGIGVVYAHQLKDFPRSKLPIWIHQWLDNPDYVSTSGGKEAAKVSFLVKPHPSSILPLLTGISESLKIGNPQPHPFHSGQKLNASRTLRVEKIAGLIESKLITHCPEDIMNGGDREPVAVLLQCQDRLLDPRMTLGAVKYIHWRGGGDLVFYYLLASDDTTSASL